MRMLDRATHELHVTGFDTTHHLHQSACHTAETRLSHPCNLVAVVPIRAESYHCRTVEVERNLWLET